MTPYRLLSPTVKVSPLPFNPPSVKSKTDIDTSSRASTDDSRSDRIKSDAAKDRASKRNVDRSDKISASKLKNEKQKISPSDPAYFEHMMAALLTLPSPAQNLPAITAAASAPSQGQDSSVSSIDPAVLVIPQPVAGTAINAGADKGFSAELLSALTPGIPAPTENQTALMTQIEASASSPIITVTPVPVPVISADDAITSSLTLPSGIDLVDPRMIACGFNPYQMDKLKNFLNPVKLPNTDLSIGKTAAGSSLDTDSGIVTVSFAHPKPLAPVLVNLPLQAAPVELDILIASNGINEPVQLLTAGINAKSATDAASVDAAEQQAVLSGESFDPVEFRIAQSFQRPVSQAHIQGQPSSVNTNNSPVSVSGMPSPAPGNVSLQHAINASISGHVNTMHSDMSTLSFSSLLPQAVDTQSESTANLTVAPASLPTVMSPLTSTAVQSSSAAQSHPAIQVVAAVIAKNAKEGGAQTISMRLDPPDLGKLQVEMKYKKGDPLKVHVVLEKADTAQMFQRDSHALASTLKDAGLELDGSSLSFEFSGQGGFQEALGNDNVKNAPLSSSVSSNMNELASIESRPDIYTDTKTGLTHYNLRV